MHAKKCHRVRKGVRNKRHNTIDICLHIIKGNMKMKLEAALTMRSKVAASTRTRKIAAR